MPEFHEISDIEIEEKDSLTGGFIRYYGLYWDRKYVRWDDIQLLAVPLGKSGQGKPPKTEEDNWNCINFWAQKGIYILYDSEMYPVYAGQAGVLKKNSSGGNNIGGRLNAHRLGKYRNAWRYFSWFGFLEHRGNNIKLRNLERTLRLNPDWYEVSDHSSDLNSLLASFEAIIIEGFIPRLNARGGDLKQAVRCDQYEGEHALISNSS